MLGKSQEERVQMDNGWAQGLNGGDGMFWKERRRFRTLKAGSPTKMLTSQPLK